MHLAFLRAPAVLACCGVLVGLTVSACGSSSPKAATSAQIAEQEFVKFARCMREHGVNTTAPTGSSGFLKVTGGDPQKLEAARAACRRYRPAAAAQKLTPAQRAERQDQVLKFARCMREHGVDVPDPRFSSGGGVGIRFRLQDVHPESPAFQRAAKSCEGLLPKRRFGRGAGAGPVAVAPGG